MCLLCICFCQCAVSVCFRVFAPLVMRQEGEHKRDRKKGAQACARDGGNKVLRVYCEFSFNTLQFA